MSALLGFGVGRTCPSCRHQLLLRRRFYPTVASSHQSLLNSARLRLAETGSHRKVRRRKDGPEEGQLGFFESSFLRGRVLGLGGGHVGRSVEAIDEGTADPVGSPPAPAGKTYSPSAEAASFATPFWRPLPTLTWRRRLALYQSLAKFRLSSLVVLTAMAGYAMAPADPFPIASYLSDESFLSTTLQAVTPSTALLSTPAAGGGLFSLPTLLSTALGTLLCSASANTINQLVEAPYDAQMSRTRGRPMVRRLVTPFHAATFASVTGLTGVSTLLFLVNPLTACLGAANIVLYAFVYTPLKRVSIVNTWVGAIVGAIPPLMGWSASSGSLLHPGAWLLCLASFAWQFPHFNSFAHVSRRDYAKAGYRMMSVTDPALNARVSLRYALLWFPLCSWAIPAVGMTSWAFAGLSVLPNALMAVPAARFWWKGGDKEARRLFWASLVHLPVVLVLMMACKKREAEKEAETEQG